MDRLTVVALLAIAAPLGLAILGRLRASLTALGVAIFLLPGVMFGSTAADAYRVGISGAQPRLMTYTVALVGSWFLLAFRIKHQSPRRSLAPIIPLILFILTWPWLFWDISSEVLAGLMHLSVAALAWVVGGLLAGWLHSRPEHLVAFVRMVLGLVLLQSVIVVAQWGGVDILQGADSLVTSSLAAEDATLVGRPTGTFGHPSTLGKLLFLLLVVMLPMTSSPSKAVSRPARATVLLAVVPLVLTGGRANFVATAVLVMGYAVLDPGAARWAARLRVSITAGIILALSWGVWVERFRLGDDGSSRLQLNAVALRFLDANGYWLGTGANTYVSAVGPTDSLTASGWPVHNVALLATVELGLIGAAALLFPFIFAISTAIRNRRHPYLAGAVARSLTASTPGLLLITMTGWGMLGDPLIPWMMMTSLCLTWMRLQQPHNKLQARVSSETSLGLSAARSD